MPAVVTAALLLLLGGPAPARADDAPAAYDPRDLNQDGTVTGKERRQYRRAHRSKNVSGKSDAPAAAQEEAAAADATAHSAAAGSKASAAAAAMKASLAAPDAAAKAGANAGAAAPETKASANPADPRSLSDFVLAARSGYAPAFAAAGLRLGPDGRAIVRADGTPATAEDYARLRRAILDLPAALSRRPDFFAAVPPSHFNALKDGYRGSPGPSDSIYKHVGTTAEDRDFVHTASCSKMSGDCNENVEKASYKKGDYVAPEDLDRMWAALQKEVDDAGGNPDGAPARFGAPTAPRARAAEDGGVAENAGASAAASGPAGGTAATAATMPAAIAGRAVRRLWRGARAALGLEPGNADGPSSRPFELGALGAAVLAALVFGLRKKV